MNPSPFREFLPSVWVAEGEIQMPMTKLAVRATAVEVNAREWVLVSPLHPKMCDYSSLKARGEVVAIVAPNCFHHLFVTHAKKEFPQATLWGARGLRVKRPEVPWDKEFGRDEWPYGGVMRPHFIAGMPKVNEVVFYLPKVKCLLVTDLFFNLRQVKGLGARVVFSVMGTFRRFAMSRLFRIFAKDREQTKITVCQLLDWDITALVMAHGETVHSGAKPLIEAAVQERL